MVLTAVLVVSLAAAASRLGPVVGGVLAALPALASILAVFTHEQHGAHALVVLLRGMLSGMAGFVVFCALVAVLAERAGVGATFTAAALAAVCLQGAAARAASAPAASRIRLISRRSFQLARRIAMAIIGAPILEKPAGSPRLRSDISVPPSGVSAQV